MLSVVCAGGGGSAARGERSAGGSELAAARGGGVVCPLAARGCASGPPLGRGLARIGLRGRSGPVRVRGELRSGGEGVEGGRFAGEGIGFWGGREEREEREEEGRPLCSFFFGLWAKRAARLGARAPMGPRAPEGFVGPRPVGRPGERGGRAPGGGVGGGGRERTLLLLLSFFFGQGWVSSSSSRARSPSSRGLSRGGASGC